MTAYPPPLYSFTGLNFNPTIFETTQASGLTQGQANALYLQKTVADTATAIETFNAGIKTNSIDINTDSTTNIMTTTTKQINLGTANSRVGLINIGTGSSGTINSGIRLGSRSGSGIIQLLSPTTVSSLNAYSSGSGLNIADSTITGAINIAINTLDGINIGNPDSEYPLNLNSNEINIGTNNYRTGLINIGTGNYSVTGSNVRIGANSGDGEIELLAPTSFTTLKGTTPSTTLSIASTTTSGDILIASACESTLSIGGTLTSIYQNGTTTFDNPPKCFVVANLPEDIPNKDFIDIHVSSSGSLQLFLTYQTIQTSPYRTLGTVYDTTTTGTDFYTPQLGTNLIASFLTPVGYPYITTIPSGVWTLNQYACLDGTVKSGTVQYYFKVYKGTIGSFTLLGTSVSSLDVTTTSPTVYYCYLNLDTQTILTTDRIMIEIYTIGVDNDPASTIDNFYDNGYYSYITCPLLPGSNLLLTNNTFLGSNNFTTQTAGNNSTLASTTAFVSTAISALSSIYQTAAQVTTAITSYGYQTAAQVTTAITSYGYQTASQVTTAITNLKAANNTWSGTNNFTNFTSVSSNSVMSVKGATTQQLVIFGTGTASTAGVTISFGQTFNVAPYVFLTGQNANAQGVSANSITTTNFKLYSSAGGPNVQWMAIGN